MRLFLELISLKKCIYDKMYFHKLQGFIYNVLRETEYGVLHNKPGYKFFCFSNIFPINDMKPGDSKNLIISSPDKIFIKLLKEKLIEFIDSKKPLNIGEMQFEIKEIKKFSIKLNSSRIKLISATPIIIKIPEKNYEKYKIPEKYRKKRYVYWRPQYDFNAFLKQLEENIFKKYKDFYKTEIKEFPIFEGFKFNSPANPRVVIKGREYSLVGSYWEFYFSGLNHDKQKRKILEFAIDCGFGEKNAYGFGFINKII